MYSKFHELHDNPKGLPTAWVITSTDQDSYGPPVAAYTNKADAEAHLSRLNSAYAVAVEVPLR